MEGRAPGSPYLHSLSQTVPANASGNVATFIARASHLSSLSYDRFHEGIFKYAEMCRKQEKQFTAADLRGNPRPIRVAHCERSSEVSQRPSAVGRIAGGRLPNRAADHRCRRPRHHVAGRFLVIAWFQAGGVAVGVPTPQLISQQGSSSQCDLSGGEAGRCPGL